MLAICKRDIPGYKEGQKVSATDIGTCILVQENPCFYAKMEREDFFNNFEKVGDGND